MKPARGRWVLALGLGLWVCCGLVDMRQAAAASITGQVHEAATGTPARGVSLRLVYDDQDAISPGAAVAPEDLGLDQQGQVTGPDGAYRFDVPGGRRYRLVLDTSQSAYAAPSTHTPPRAGFAPLGEVVSTPAPAPPGDASADRAYYLRFDLPDDADEVRNNHVAVDRASQVITLVKRVDRAQASPGDVLGYTVVVHNGSARDLTRDAGQGVYILDAPARGLAIAPGQAVARIEPGQDGAPGRLLRAGVDFGDTRENPASGRMVRFGPFDLAAGATLVLEYPVTVGMDARPGTRDNRAVLMSAGGVALSPEGRARVHIAPDPTLDSGLILGRVFCDDNHDGQRNTGEPALMGARVYLDTGSYAVTDPDGAYHLSRVRPGTRLVKIDSATLAGGTVQGTPERLLTLSRGLAARVDFAVGCKLVAVGLGRAQRSGAATAEPPAAGPAASGPALIEVAGEVAGKVTGEDAGGDGDGRGAAVRVTVAGEPVALPMASLELEVPDSVRAGPARNLQPVPADGYGEARPAWRPGWTGPGGVEVAAWKLDIGMLGEDGAITPVRALQGTGRLPEQIDWDGLDRDGAPAAAGRAYAAQLVVKGSARQARAASAWKIFGIGLGGPVEETWRGPLFTDDPRAPAATPALEERARALAGRLGPGDRVEILVHADGTGDRLSALVQTQKQAQSLASLLVQAGVSEERISARGRGSLEPLQADGSEAARDANRRILVTVTPGQAPSFPEMAPRPTEIAINGAPVSLTGNRFSTRVRPSARNQVLVDVHLPDGGRTTLAIPTPHEVAGTSHEVAGTSHGEVAGTSHEVAGTSHGEVAGTSQQTEITEVPEVAGTSHEVAGTSDRGTSDSTSGEVAGTSHGTSDGEVAGTSSGGIEVHADLAAGTITVAGQPVSPGLLAVDALLDRDAPGDGTAPSKDSSSATPLTFTLTVPAAVPVRSWLFEISEAGGGATVHRAAGPAPAPAAHTWNGTAPDGTALMVPGTRYVYQLTITTADGARGMSPPRPLAPAPAPRRAELAGELFTPAGQLAPDTQAQLAALVQKDAAGTRYRVELTLAARAGSTVEVRLAQAARAAALKKTLAALGLAAERYELHTGTHAEAGDTISIEAVTPAPEPAAESALAQPARVLLDGKVQEVAGNAWHARIAPDAPGEPMTPVTIDLTTPDGHRAVLELAPRAGNAVAAGSDASATRPGNPAQASASPAQPTTMTSRALAAGTTVRLPRSGTLLKSRTLAVSGRTLPGARIIVTAAPNHDDGPDSDDTGETTATRAQELSVSTDGRFAGLVTLPPGASTLAIRAVAPDGQQAHLSWPVTVDDRHLFFMALGEAAASTAFVHEERDGRTRARGMTADTAHLDGLDPASSVRVGPLRLHGRVAMYLKGSFSAGTIAPRVDVTAHLDTAREPGTGAFFEQLTDPRTAAPTHGDTAEEVRDANTRGRLYVHLDAGDARAIVGSVHTDLQGGDLFRYDRTLDGAVVEVDRAGDGYRVQVRGFGATGLSELRQDVNWYRATGGSLYYLRHGQVIEGSERIRVIVRDAESGLATSERVLARDRDYRIDYASGRVMLTEPLASTAAAPWLVDDLQTSTAPLLGNPVFLEVRYEHADPAGLASTAERAAGVYARGTVGRVSAGAGVVGEGRDSGSYSLWGADATVRAGERSRVHLELAGSRRSQAPGFLSVDGGLQFAGMDGGLIEVNDNRDQLAWKLTQDWHAGDLFDRGWAERTRLQIVAQHVDRGFSAGDAAFAQGRLELGALLTHQLSERDTLLVRHHSRVARIPRLGPTQDEIDANPEPDALDRHSSHLTAVQWSRAQGRWHHRLEASHQRLRADARLTGDVPALDARRLGLAGATALAYSRRLTLRAGQQLTMDLGQADPRLDPIPAPSMDAPGSPGVTRDSDPLAGVISNLGADWALTDDLALGADWYQRWNGDSAGQVGLRTRLSETGSMYLRQRLGAQGGRPVATTVIGAEDQTRDPAGRLSGNRGSGRTYGEYQIENSYLGQRDRAVLGLGHGWEVAPGARLSLGFEHQQVLGGVLPDGTPIGASQRELLHGGGAYTRPEQLEARARVELRLDRGDSSAAALTDQRPGVPPGSVADHGGIAPGAAAALAPGRRVQVLLGTGVAWRFAPAHTLIGRAYIAHTVAHTEDADTDDDQSFTAAQNIELTAGWAYRPPVHDWLNLVLRYSYLADLRPRSDSWPDTGAADAGTRAAAGIDPGIDASAVPAWHSRSHVLALVPLVDLPHRFDLSGKLAWKHTSVSEAHAPDAAEARASALLWLARLGYRLYGRWDAGFELRGLHLGKPGQGADAREDRVGTLLELGYHIQRHIRLGIGYNMSRFSDDELGDLERDSHGAFIRVTGHY